jgi:zinc-binding in reverse transcriptase
MEMYCVGIIHTTASAYKFLTNTSHIRTKRNLSWKIKAPTRVQIFAWLTIHNKILTTVNLIKRGFNLPNMCRLCRVQQKMVPRLLKESTYTYDSPSRLHLANHGHKDTAKRSDISRCPAVLTHRELFEENWYHYYVCNLT